MPVLLSVPQDPTDLVLAGEEMRMSVLEAPVVSVVDVLGGGTVIGFSSVLTDEDAYSPMNSMIDGVRLSMRRSKAGDLQLRANAGIATPCGAWVYLDYTPLMNPLLWATERWALVGVTKDGAGAALADCRVIAFETGRLTVEDALEATIGEVMSDGSGNYSIPVPMNTGYQLTAYKPGAPDLAGITRNDVAPVAVG